MFYCDTRHLSRFEFQLNGCTAAAQLRLRDDNVILAVASPLPDFYLDQRLVLPRDAVHTIRSIFLWTGRRMTFWVRNFREQTSNYLFVFFCNDFSIYSRCGDAARRRGEHRARWTAARHRTITT